MKADKTQNREGVHLWLLLWKATRTLEAKAHQSIADTGLGLSDFGVLEALLHKGPLPVNAFREKVLLSSGSTTAAVDRLERSGLVKRELTPADRRSRIVHLTEKGSKLISKLFEEHASDMERAFSHLGKNERDTLASLLRKLGREAGNRPALKEKSIATRKKRS
jgi:MarR family 2-MHQ and catechol resistance regulon transcriptional repressor